MSAHRVGISDDHAHPFPLAPDVLDLAGITLDVADDYGASARRRALAPGRLVLEAMRLRLAALLGCPAEEVEPARADAARDWAGYVHRLFADVGLSGMLLDGGTHFVDPGALAEYESVAGGIPMRSLLRLETVIDPLLAAGCGADEVLDAVGEAVSAAAAAGAVGCKTVLAYRTGLAVDADATLADARRSVRDAGTDLPVPRRAKALRDLVLRRALAQCGELGLPVQVHTGFGDSELRLADADPLGLDDLLRTPEARRAAVVLIHAAYPWHEQVAYLAAVRESVWAEFSLVNLLSPATSADRLLRLVELAPTGRILVGSDGHGPPETHWFALGVIRDAWARVRAGLGGLARDGWLDDVERAILADNARTLYGLDR
jgi:predicted TIM-barrel fold metal-dependent hydrolase